MHRPGVQPGTARGFSLIEVMIAVAVIAMLIAIALPNYTSYMRRSARAEIQAAMTDIAARQAQFLVDRRAYAATVAATGWQWPSGLSSKYTLTLNVVAGPPPSFSLTADAQGSQASDKCPSMTIDSAGTRSPANCW
jgi:type IV pilus assembly protein PilE